MSSPAEICKQLISPALNSYSSVSSFPVIRKSGKNYLYTSDDVAEEVAVAIVYNSEPHVVMLMSPCDLEDFALGFSLTEKIIERPDEIESVHTQYLQDGIQLSINIPLPRGVAVNNRKRNLAGRSGCGLCGTALLKDAIRQPDPVSEGIIISAEAVRNALDSLNHLQEINSKTGAVHAAAWASLSGAILTVREDVGRHNALDKLIGKLAKHKIAANPANGFLIVTSRASYEMVMKAAMFGITTMVAISAPTALAIRMAEACNITLIGFARNGRFIIYSHDKRIENPEVQE